MAEPLTDDFLEQVGFLVGAFGTAEPCHFAPATAQPIGGDIQRLVPACLAEMGLPVRRIDIQPLGGRVLAPDQWFGQAVVMVDIVETEPPLDAKPPLVGGPVDPIDIFDPAILDLERDLAADPAERADAGDLTVVIGTVALLIRVQHGGFHQRTSRAGLHAFAAGHAGRGPHWVSHIESRKGVVAAA